MHLLLHNFLSSYMESIKCTYIRRTYKGSQMQLTLYFKCTKKNVNSNVIIKHYTHINVEYKSLLIWSMSKKKYRSGNLNILTH